MERYFDRIKTTGVGKMLYPETMISSGSNVVALFIVRCLQSWVSWASYPDGVVQVGVSKKFLKKLNWFLLQTTHSGRLKPDKCCLDEFNNGQMSVTWR